jgi:nicotinate-nucleotide adenylyltransferase
LLDHQSKGVTRPERPGLGVLGGSFDPVHRVHLRLACNVRAALGLERVLLVPAAHQPLKNHEVAAALDRRAMLQLAVQELAGLEVCDIELRRPGPSYTIDTLRALRASWPEHRLWFVLGADALADFAAWREPETLFSLASFAVVPRGGHRSTVCLSSMLPARFAPAFRRGPHGLVHESGEELRALPFEPSEISSSEIRARLRKGEEVREWLPEPVLAYIQAHGLYQQEEC